MCGKGMIVTNDDNGDNEDADDEGYKKGRELIHKGIVFPKVSTVKRIKPLWMLKVSDEICLLSQPYATTCHVIMAGRSTEVLTCSSSFSSLFNSSPLSLYPLHQNVLPPSSLFFPPCVNLDLPSSSVPRHRN